MEPTTLQLPGYVFARRHEEVASTMDVARDSATLLATVENGAGLECTRRQTAGRGRQGRSWSGTGDSFMGTFLFAARSAAHQFSGYSLAVGCAVAGALDDLGVGIALKWPNDLVSVKSGKISKVGGILIEVQDVGEQRIVLVGIGINVRAAPQDVPGAASLLDICEQNLSPEALEAPLATRLLAMHRCFIDHGGFSQFCSDWMELSCFVPGSTQVSIDLGSRTVSGTFEGLDPNGAMLLSSGGGPEAVLSGHIVVLSGLRDTL